MRKPVLRAALLPAIVVAAWLATPTAEADEVRIIGAAKVIDGDTLAIGPLRIRLNGVDAAEIGQTCQRDDGRNWDCANAAALRLERLVGKSEITCIALDRDAYGRIVASCEAEGIDVGRTLVAEGLAWAFERYSDVYVPDQTSARNQHLGVWEGAAEPPWNYRENRWDRAAAESPRPGCPIKGNISVGSGEHIYHTPWSPVYEKTVIDVTKGERWFCDEGEAVAAGWRAARFR